MKKITAIMLAFLMVVSIIPMSVFADVEYDLSKSDCDYYNIIEKNDYALAPGATESEIVINDDEGSRRNVVHVMEVDLSNPNISVMPGQKNISEDVDYTDTSNWGTQIVRDHATHAEENLGLNVVGAMNVSLTWSFIHPYGLLVYKGKVLYDDRANHSGGGYLAITKDGKAELREPKAALTGNEWMAQTICFHWLVKDGKSLYAKEDHTSEGAPRSVIGIKEDGTLVLMMNDGRQSPYSAGFTNHEMAETMLALGCVDAINCDGGGSSTFITEREGTGELVMQSSPSDGSERQTLSSILVISEAEADGKFDHAALEAEDTFVTPGASVKVNATGADKSGGPAEVPEDISWQLKDASMGTVKDGVFTSNGTEGQAVVQLVYDGELDGKTYVDGIALDGWVGDSYYKDGAMLKGIQAVDGVYYDFGEDGVCKNKVKYTGLYKDGDVYKYLYLGAFKNGWQMINNEWYYFDTTTNEAATGEKKFFNTVTYTFEETGRLTEGVWLNDGLGYRYYYGPKDVIRGFYTVDGKQHFFVDHHLCETGIYYMELSTGNGRTFYQIDENNEFAGEYKKDGLIECVDGLYYGIDGKPQTGLFKVDGDYYCVNKTGIVIKGEESAPVITSCDLPAGVGIKYSFGADGKMLQGIVDGYYYKNGQLTYAGLVKVGDDFYYAGKGGKCVTGKKYFARKSKCVLPVNREYTFDADGKIVK